MPKAPSSAPSHSVGVVSRSPGSYAGRSVHLPVTKSAGSRIGGNVGDQSQPSGTALSRAKRWPSLTAAMAQHARVGL